MPNFFLVCGISGGGKTTLSHRIQELNPEKIDIVLDSDEYYAKINGDEKIRDNKFTVWITLYQDIHKYETEGKNILLTTNSLTVSQRTQFLEWFPTFDHHMLWVTAPLEKCFEGNKSRYRSVPENILLRQWQEMEFPNASEKGWASITHITNCWDFKNYIPYILKGNINDILRFQ